MQLNGQTGPEDGSNEHQMYEGKFTLSYHRHSGVTAIGGECRASIVLLNRRLTSPVNRMVPTLASRGLLRLPGGLPFALRIGEYQIRIQLTT
jgi:hypothetical protein